MKKLRNFNICMVMLFILFITIFTTFFSIKEIDISRDISEKNRCKIEILNEKYIDESKIIYFSTDENKRGVANYLKIPLLNRYFCEKMYAGDNTNGDYNEIDDVFKGRWNLYCIKATEQYIKILNIDKYKGVYWGIFRNIFCLLVIIVTANVYWIHKMITEKNVQI